jgi:hypothetical protein
MKKILVCVFFFIVSVTSPAFAGNDVEALKGQLEQMSQMMETLQKKIETLEKDSKEGKEEVEYISGRVDKAELHTVTDKISLGVDIRTEGHSIHYGDVQVAPSALIGGFTTPYASGGFDGATLNEIQGMMGYMMQNGLVPPTEKYDVDNDFIPTTKFNLNMKAKINNSLRFDGRLAAYKVWGDSSGVKFNTGSLGDVTLDGNTTSIPHGDTIRLERAYFLYSKDFGDVPVSMSLGRRPSTDGPPVEYGRNSLEAGSPLATIINWQFDGASLNFGLEDITGIAGSALKFCYGLGFEGGWGNSYSLSNDQVDDVHMFGFIATLYNDDTTSAVLNYAHAWDITDGFTGLTVMPLIAYENMDGTFDFDENTGAFITRMQPVTEIGDWDGASLLLRTNLDEKFEKDIDLFFSASWSHTDPSNVSNNAFYKVLGQGLLSSMGQLESQHGYMVYAGARFAMPLDGKLGLEYNWGSKYWFNFTGAEDALAGSKLATRGSVYEAYYIQPIVSDNFFVKLGAKYYDYKYTGSGNPLGAPVEIDDATSLDAIFPIFDTVWDVYASVTLRF